VGHFLALGRYYSLFKAKYKNFGHYIVVEMYYKMFVPIGFQVWAIYRPQIEIFAELLPIL